MGVVRATQESAGNRDVGKTWQGHQGDRVLQPQQFHGLVELPIPADLQEGVNFNWQEWLGPAPKVAYNPERVFRYRKYWDYSGGISTDLFVHLITSIHFIMDAEMPKSIAANGGILYLHDGREVPDTLYDLFDYGSFCVNMAGTFNCASTAGQGIQFLGTEGSLSVLLGAGMIEQPEYKRENYEYSIDSWPKGDAGSFSQSRQPPSGIAGNRHQTGTRESGVCGQAGRDCSASCELHRCGSHPTAEL